VIPDAGLARLPYLRWHADAVHAARTVRVTLERIQPAKLAPSMDSTSA
jgi:hypothetical protein